MSDNQTPRPGDLDDFLRIVSWAVIVAGVIVILGAGGCIIFMLPTEGGLSMIVAGPPLLFGLGAVYVAWNLIKRLKP